MATIASLVVDIAANTATLQKDVTQIDSTLNKITGTASKVGAAMGVAFSVTALVGFGKQLIADADALVKMSDKTGVSLQALQKFQIVGDDAGNTVDQLTSAIVKMEDKLAGGDKSAVAALQKLGIPFEDIKNLNPENQFIAISDAIRKIQDPAQQVSIAIDLFGKAGAEVLPTLKKGFDDVRDAVVGMSDETIATLDEAGDIMDAFGRKTKAVASTALVMFVNFVRDGLDPIDRAAREVEDLGKQLEKMGNSLKAATKDVAPPFKAITAAVAETSSANLDVEKSIKKVDTAAREAKDAMNEWNASIQKATISANLSVFTLHRFGAIELPNVESSLKDVDLEIHELASRTLPDFEVNLGRVGSAGVKTFGDLRTDATKMRDSIKDIFAGLPDLMVKSFTGGGGVVGAFKALGVQIADALITPIMAGLSKAARTAIGIGTAGASGLGQAIGGGRGGQVAGAASAVAGSVFAGSATGVAAAAGSTAAMVTLGAATMGVGLAAVGAYMLIRRWFGDGIPKEVKLARDSFIDAAGGIEQLGRKAAGAGVTLDAMLNARTPTAYKAAVDALNASFEFQDQAMQTLDETVKKYNFSIDQLGPSMQRQELGKKFEELFQDFQILNAAGVDQVAVTQAMSASVSQYVQDAIRMGIEIPAAMKPMLEKFIFTGDLIDENGAKITDLSKIKFAETITQGFDRVVNAVQSLVDAIERGLKPSLNSIPRNIETTVTTSYIEQRGPRGFIGEQPEEMPGIHEGFAGGTHGRYLDFGAGTPVMLHGRERVMTEGEREDGGLGSKLDTLIAIQQRQAQDLPRVLGRAVRELMQVA